MSDAPLPPFLPLLPPSGDGEDAKTPTPAPPDASAGTSAPPADPSPIAEPAPSEREPDASRPTPRLRRGWRWLALFIVVTVPALGILGVRTNAGVEATYAHQARFVAQAEAAFSSIPLLTDDEVALLRRSRNARHVELAEALGAGPPASRAELDSLRLAVGAVSILNDSLYAVLPGQYSVPVLTPSGAASLDSVAARFRDRLATKGLPPFRFSVSSVWRSAADQAALRGGNVNAAAGHSSHEYGTTYDITYNPTRYSPAPDALPPPPPIDDRVPGFMREMVEAALVREQIADLNRLAAEYPSRLTALLGRALIDLEDEGVLVVVRERLQPVYHITVARELVP